MARPWIEFIFAQNLPWDAGVPGAEWPGLLSKTLSLDDASGAASLLLRYPSGWRAAGEAIAAEEEIYVLDGALTVNGAALKRDSYVTIPAAQARRIEAGPDGAVTLSFFDRAPKPVVATASDAPLAPIDTLAMKWDDSGVPPDLQYMGIKRKVLRRDAASGQQRTFLLTTAPHNYPKNWACPTLTHPCVEEMFQLAGDMSGPHGRMTAGAYFYRPPDVAHGPFGSRDGSLALIRFIDGKHVNIWGDHDVAFDYDVPYAPAVPAALKKYALGPYRGAERY